MDKRYNVMLVGCGHIGEEHIADIYYRDNVAVSAVVDSDIERARLFSVKYGAAHYGTDYRLFLSDPQLDIVIIATYADTHLSILEDCLAAGKHVLCEKPIASTLEDGKRFYRAVLQSDRQVLVAHVLRHNRSYRRIARMIREGAIGELRLMRMVQNHHAMDWPRYKRLMEDCPPIVDCGVHYLDVMQWFSGSRIVEVGGFEAVLDDDWERGNHGMIHARLENGCVGYYEAGWSRNLASQNLKEFVGDRGRITLVLKENRVENREEGDLITLYSSLTGEYTAINVQSEYKDMYGQLMALIGMIEGGNPAEPTIEEAYSAFAAALRAAEAIRLGTRLPVDKNLPVILEHQEKKADPA